MAVEPKSVKGFIKEAEQKLNARKLDEAMSLIEEAIKGAKQLYHFDAPPSDQRKAKEYCTLLYEAYKMAAKITERRGNTELNKYYLNQRDLAGKRLERYRDVH